MRWSVALLVVGATVIALHTAVAVATASAERSFAWIDPHYDANRVAVEHYSARVQYVDALSSEQLASAQADEQEDEAEAEADAEGEESEGGEDVAFVSVKDGDGDDNGIYYDAANMPSWLTPPWVTPNSPTGPLIPTYGSGYLTKTFNIKQWKGAVPPQPVFPLDSGYAASSIDSDHFPYGGVFPNDARYHSPSLTVTAPIFAETEVRITAHRHAFRTAEVANRHGAPPKRVLDQAEADTDAEADSAVDEDEADE